MFRVFIVWKKFLVSLFFVADFPFLVFVLRQKMSICMLMWKSKKYVGNFWNLLPRGSQGNLEQKNSNCRLIKTNSSEHAANLIRCLEITRKRLRSWAKKWNYFSSGSQNNPEILPSPQTTLDNNNIIIVFTTISTLTQI